jgi:hypothetical protein
LSKKPLTEDVPTNSISSGGIDTYEPILSFGMWRRKHPVNPEVEKASIKRDDELKDAIRKSTPQSRKRMVKALKNESINENWNTMKKNPKVNRFAGNDVFVVDDATFQYCQQGKKKFLRWEKYVGKNRVGDAIRAYGRDRKNKGKPIVLQHERSGAMIYLKYGHKKGLSPNGY